MSDILPTKEEVELKLLTTYKEMTAWVEGRHSWTNLGPNPPYTPDVIARMNAAEVTMLAAAIFGYKEMLKVYK